jgi:hypothetical protein
MRYDVTVKEVWVQTYTVHADSEEEAIQKVQDGDCETQDGSFEYSHAQESDTWDIAESVDLDQEES